MGMELIAVLKMRRKVLINIRRLFEASAKIYAIHGLLKFSSLSKNFSGISAAVVTLFSAFVI